MAGIKIVDLPALGRDLISTDLLELSLAGGTGSRKITGQEIMNASKLSVGNTPIINGAVGQVLFQGTGNVLQESANLFWDNTNGRLGIGTSSPTFPLDVVAPQYGGFRFTASDATFLRLDTTTTNFTISQSNTQTSLTTSNYGPLYFINNGAASIRLSLFANGNFAIGSTTDAGFRLDVNGTARFVDTTTFSSNIRCSAINPLINQNLEIQATWADSVYVRIRTITNKPQVLIVEPAANLTLTSGTHDTQRILHTFAPTSGTAVINALTLNQTINQTGGASGITRGLYVNPTLTAAADFRAIETTAGNVIFNGGNVGIGTSSPSYKLHVVGSAGFDNGASGDAITLLNSGFIQSSLIRFRGFSTQFVIQDNSYNNKFVVSTSGSLSYFNTGGNVAIGTTTDAGFRLDVNGTARVSGELRVGSLQLLTSGSPGATGQGITTTGKKISFQSQGEINIDGATAYQLLGYADSPISMVQNAPGRTIGFLQVKGGFSGPNFNSTNANLVWMNPTYNMQGTSNTGQILRGIYYNPTLTDLTNATHFAFHSTSGRVRFEGLPTSPTGLNAGDIYNDGGTLKIV